MLRSDDYPFRKREQSLAEWSDNTTGWMPMCSPLGPQFAKLEVEMEIVGISARELISLTTFSLTILIMMSILIGNALLIVLCYYGLIPHYTSKTHKYDDEVIQGLLNAIAHVHDLGPEIEDQELWKLREHIKITSILDGDLRVGESWIATPMIIDTNTQVADSRRRLNQLAHRRRLQTVDEIGNFVEILKRTPELLPDDLHEMMNEDTGGDQVL